MNSIKSFAKVCFALLLAVTFVLGGFQGNANAADSYKVGLQADTGKWLSRCNNCQNAVGTNPDTATVHIDKPVVLVTTANVPSANAQNKNFITTANVQSVNPQSNDRPSFPFGGTVPTGRTRHHIIPWKHLVESAEKELPSNKRKQFLMDYSMLRPVTISRFKFQTGADIDNFLSALNNKEKEAVETYREIIAWLPGNIVIGPSNRPNDPGDNFDKYAFACLRKVSSGSPVINAIINGYNQQSNLAVFTTLQTLSKINPIVGVNPIKTNPTVEDPCWNL
ncbi:MAG: hypothetical protein JGK21_05220 [Microcoleus sp. PH2017_22_RUC_O_B]|uniref:hypothetical protein n=1 Tax=unclassified Microcoleus TaxID=2642155 RepID=UPI001D8203D1|nr:MULTISPECIES: hypothetical protein [unclassified Microcoleus]MCC3527681.1 hypothetical protein [Microcoleus sp. PH2017_21_RUC_O_A]MCC3539783.1 hypothetical protein [Microcoleus sp. PH2017_22_RUC_O_B]